MAPKCVLLVCVYCLLNIATRGKKLAIGGAGLVVWENPLSGNRENKCPGKLSLSVDLVSMLNFELSQQTHEREQSNDNVRTTTK
ncbi:hypothetical protein BGZ63DRAFT_381711 [Mariannaea sp. PMI_226]|nr:hypothetical protein BGZ63DRAFT_381711 [Mariannaea sp. PMI_226]